MEASDVKKLSGEGNLRRRSMAVVEEVAKFSSIGVDESVMPSTSSLAEEPDLEPFRCYAEPYPDLNNKGVADIVLISIGSIRPNVLPKPYPPICIDPALGWNRGRRLMECIESYTRRTWQFDALDKFFASIPEQLCEEYLTTVIPFMATLALSAPDLITQCHQEC
uniref:Uncharacterized protein n=1 Tax=Parascaris equorum TaxID=6256 RepID=A0A914RNP2_PAREQ